MHLLARFVEPPRLRTTDDADEERRATWLELFFDLVFVVTVAELGNNLGRDVSVEGFLEFLALFVPVWWVWMGFTFYANRFDTDDLPYRLLTLVAMLGVAALATNVGDAFEGGSAGFAASYAAVRCVLLVLYVRARRHVKEARRLATWFLTVFSIAVGIWLASLLVDEPARYWLWAVALALELGAPIVGWRLIPQAPIHPAHIPERFGLLTIIVLGESVFAVVLGVTDVQWKTPAVLAAVAGFVAAASLWWIYFDFLDSSVVRRGIFAGLVFTYSHFTIVAGLAAMGIGVKLAILASTDERYDGSGWILCGGLALTMVGLAAIQLATPPAVFDTDVWLRLATAAFALGLLPFAETLPVLLVASLVAAVLLAQVVVELARHEVHAGAD
jgi:low temperature requirement protein LtrA